MDAKAVPPEKAPVSPCPPVGKRPYVPPTVEALGTMADLTRGVGGMNYDAGQGSNTKRGA